MKKKQLNKNISKDNLSCIDYQRLLFHLVSEHSEIRNDAVLKSNVLCAAITPKQKSYRLYEGLIDWIQEILEESNHPFSSLENVSEEDCKKWYDYVIQNYDLRSDETFLSGLALLSHMDSDSFTTEDYRIIPEDETER